MSARRPVFQPHHHQHPPTTAGVDIVSDIIQNSTLEERKIERERSVILREMQVIVCVCVLCVFVLFGSVVPQ